MKKSLLLAFTAVWLVAPGTAQATAITYGFGCITNNAPGDCAVGQAQLSVTVFDDLLPAGQVGFRFDNAGPGPSVISEIYFDPDGDFGTILSSLDSIINGVGVSFVSGSVAPPDLPSGNTASPPFQAQPSFSAEAAPPPTTNGVGPGENVALIFNLVGGKSYLDVINAIEGPIGTGDDLRMGLHVTSFETGASESFVNTQAAVPEPGTLLLLGAGLTGLAQLQRRRRH